MKETWNNGFELPKPDSCILFIDPGSRHAGSVILEPRQGELPRLISTWNSTAEEFVTWLRSDLPAHVSGAVIEQVGHYGTGMSAGKDVFDTCRYIGRLEECLERRWLRWTKTLRRQTVKTFLCGKATANDTNVRQALIDLWGGDTLAIGGRKCQACKGNGWRGRGRPTCTTCRGLRWKIPPGPLHGVAGHAWSALAVGACYLEVRT